MNEEHVARLLIGESPAIRGLRALIIRVAPTTLPVVIEGPTGSGKELVAQALHAVSGRRGEFVPFNVCALSDTMFEDALFGHVRGAFTGAVRDHPGFLAEANGGTLLLDEISGLSRDGQTKLLRAIETGEYRPVGGRRNLRSDFRLLVASNEKIDELVQSARFRADLAFRLKGVLLTVPPLVDRISDIGTLSHHFVGGVSAGAKALDDGAVALLEQHDWPGNVRELRQVVACAVAFACGTTITASDVDAAMGARDRGGRREAGSKAAGEGIQLLRVLERNEWRIQDAAREIGVTAKTVYSRIRKHGLDIPRRWHRRGMPGTEGNVWMDISLERSRTMGQGRD